MNELVILQGGQALTSTLAIAEGTENEHKSVIQLVRAYLDDFDSFGKVTFEMRLNDRGSPTEYALLNEQQATLLLTYMRNSEVIRKFKRRLVHAFFELAQKERASAPALPDFTNPAIAARAWADEVEAKLQLRAANEVLVHQIGEAKPKLEALDRIAGTDGSLCMRDAAKSLQMRPIDLRNWLIVNRWIYGRPGHSGWLAYQDKIQQGVMCHKITTVQREDGTDKIVEQPRITPRGLTRIAANLQKAVA